MREKEVACIFCGGDTVVTKTEREQGSKLVLESRECQICGKRFMGARLCK